MTYKYNFKIILVDFGNPYNKAVKELKELFNMCPERYLTAELTLSVKTEIQPTKKRIEILTDTLKKATVETYKQNEMDIIEFSYVNCEVVLDEEEDHGETND